MRVLLQRVARAAVAVHPAESATVEAAGGEWPVCGSIGSGFLALVGVTQGDSGRDCLLLAEKVAHLRVFPDDAGKMNLSVLDIGGAVLAVSQFTLYADCRKGRRPGFSRAEAPAAAQELYLRFITELQSLGLAVEQGCFGAHMRIELINDGPVTVLLETRDGNVV